jgi:hypothetical protein
MKRFDQENYPARAVAIVAVGADEVTLTGTNGTANITIGGIAYLVTWATDLTGTAAAFVVSHKVALGLLGIKVTSAAAVLTFVHKRAHIITNRVAAVIAAATGDLDGDMAATFTPDFNVARVFQLALACPFTIAAPINLRDGQSIRFEFTAAGAYAITWNAFYRFAGGTEHTQTSTSLDILEGSYNKAANFVYLTVESKDIKE